MLYNRLKSMGQNIMSNYFARWYYVKSARAFEKWKDTVKYNKHVESIMNRFVDHWRKYRFYAVKAAFQNFMMATRIRETKAALKHKTMEREEAMQMNLY